MIFSQQTTTSPDTSRKTPPITKQNNSHPLIPQKFNLERFGNVKQNEFWKLSHQIIVETCSNLELSVADLKTKSILLLNTIITKPKKKLYNLINLEIQKSKTKHQALLILLSLERSKISKHFDEDYKNFINFTNESPIQTSITDENYGNKYYNKFKEIGSQFLQEIDRQNNYYDTYKKETPEKLENQYFFIRPRTSFELEAPKLDVYPSLSRCLDDATFNNILSRLNEGLSREDKLAIIGELYHDSYFSMTVERGAAHNCLILMYSLYSIAFPNETLPPLKEGIMLDLELLNDINPAKSKEIFLKKFTKGEFFSNPNTP